ncbi:MAG: hypothetical protein JXR64_11020 [Spirochaetales bacterium]|nr:hypothetical protein [Spirochaetales bacterium]
MAKPIRISNELNIKEIKLEWDSIKKKKIPVSFSFKDVERFDGAGLQFLTHLLNLSSKNPDKYNIIELSDDLKTKLGEYGVFPEI